MLLTQLYASSLGPQPRGNSNFHKAGIIAALGGVGSPTIQSALTKHIPRDKTGQLLGASALLRSLARVLFPTVFNLIYADTVGALPQAVFVCLASGFFLSAGCSYFITPHRKLLPFSSLAGGLFTDYYWCVKSQITRR